MVTTMVINPLKHMDTWDKPIYNWHFQESWGKDWILAYKD